MKYPILFSLLVISYFGYSQAPIYYDNFETGAFELSRWTARANLEGTYGGMNKQLPRVCFSHKTEKHYIWNDSGITIE